MQIWLLTSELPHHRAGGIARYIYNVAQPLGAAGHKITIITPDNEQPAEPLGPNITLLTLPPIEESLHYGQQVLTPPAAHSYHLAEHIINLLHNQHQPPDIIESQEYLGLPYFLLQRKLTERGPLEKIPILVHLHGLSFEITRVNHGARYLFPHYWLGQMEKFCLTAADGLLAPSQFIATAAQRNLPLTPPPQITVIPYPTPINPQPQTPTPVDKTILFVGRLERLKGVLHLVRACSRLWATGEQFRLRLIGNDTDFLPRNNTIGGYLRQQYAPWLASGHLEIAGPQPHAAVLHAIQQAWAVVVPSLWENFPNTCLEAMAAGQVVLAARSGGQAEMIAEDGRNGYLFDWATPGEFATKLRHVLHLTPAERQSLGENARRRITHLCAPERILPQRLAHYQQVINDHQPRRQFPTLNPLPRQIEPQAAPEPGLLSVIIPFHNLGRYVADTVQSVLRSDYQPREIIIVDDGSTAPFSQQMLSIIAGWGVPRLRILRTENQGLARTRNLGAQAAQGEFIAFVDADDLVEPPFFSRAVAVLQRYDNVDFVYSWVRYFDAADDIWPTWNAELPYLLGHNMVSVLAVLRRSSFLQAGLNKPEIEYSLEDYESWLSMMAAGGVGVSLPQVLVRYRVRPDSMYHNRNVTQLLHLHDLISQTHPQLYQTWGETLFNLQNANGPAYLWPHPATPALNPAQAQVARLVNELPAQDISGWLPWRKLVKILGFKLINRAGLRWLYRYRVHAKRLLGG